MSAADGLGPLPPAKCNAGSAAFAHNAETPLYTANEVRAILAAERERCARLAVDAATAAFEKYKNDMAPVRQPYANNRLKHVGWAAADAIRGLSAPGPAP